MAGKGSGVGGIGGGVGGGKGGGAGGALQAVAGVVLDEGSERYAKCMVPLREVHGSVTRSARFFTRSAHTRTTCARTSMRSAQPARSPLGDLGQEVACDTIHTKPTPPRLSTKAVASAGEPARDLTSASISNKRNEVALSLQHIQNFNMRATRKQYCNI